MDIVTANGDRRIPLSDQEIFSDGKKFMKRWSWNEWRRMCLINTENLERHFIAEDEGEEMKGKCFRQKKILRMMSIYFTQLLYVTFTSNKNLDLLNPPQFDAFPFRRII